MVGPGDHHVGLARHNRDLGASYKAKAPQKTHEGLRSWSPGELVGPGDHHDVGQPSEALAKLNRDLGKAPKPSKAHPPQNTPTGSPNTSQCCVTLQVPKLIWEVRLQGQGVIMSWGGTATRPHNTKSHQESPRAKQDNNIHGLACNVGATSAATTPQTAELCAWVDGVGVIIGWVL